MIYPHIQVLVGSDEKTFDALVYHGRAYVLWTACTHLGASVKNLGGGKLDVNGTTLTCVIDGGQDYVLYEDLSPGHVIKVSHKDVGGKTFDVFTLADTTTTVTAKSVQVEYTDAQGNTTKVVCP